jgi:Tol biopolymer transport system component
MIFVARRTGGGAHVLHTFSGNSPAISPDGESVVFHVAAGALVVRSLATGAERVFKRDGVGAGTGGGYLHSRWLPDSSGLIVWVTPEGDGGREGGSFYHLDLKTGAFTWRFAANTPDMHLSRAGALSRDGQTFFLLGRRPSEPRWTRIVHVDPVSGKFKSEALLEGGGLAEGASVFSVAVSPDDRTLAVAYGLPVRDFADARMHILSVATDGSRVKEFSSHRSSRSPDQLAWTPDGRAVLAGIIEGGVWRVMRIPAEGGAPEFDSVDLSRLSGSAPTGAVNTANGHYGGISRDGSLIVFQARLTGGTEVWALENFLPLLTAKR